MFKPSIGILIGILIGRLNHPGLPWLDDTVPVGMFTLKHDDQNTHRKKN